MAEDTTITPGIEGDGDVAHVTDPAVVAEAAAAATAAAAAAEARPAWLPEKFKTAEDMAASYAELEKKQSKPAGTSTTVDNDLLIDTTEPKPDAVKGIDIAALEKEYNDNDGLTDATYETLKKSGLSRDDADSIIEGRLAQGMKIRDDMATIVGGEEQLQQTLVWAKANADKSELEAYNAAVTSKDTGRIKLALRGLHAGFAAEHGITPQLVDGEGAGRKTAIGFESVDDMTTAMADPRYKASPTYRAEIAARIAASE